MLVHLFSAAHTWDSEEPISHPDRPGTGVGVRPNVSLISLTGSAQSQRCCSVISDDVVFAGRLLLSAEPQPEIQSTSLSKIHGPHCKHTCTCWLPITPTNLSNTLPPMPISTALVCSTAHTPLISPYITVWGEGFKSKPEQHPAPSKTLAGIMLPAVQQPSRFL